MEIASEPYVRWRKPIKADAKKRYQGQYYRNHKDHRHGTNDCRHLNDEIEYLIRRGQLERYVKQGDERKFRGDRDNRGERRERNDHENQNESRDRPNRREELKRDRDPPTRGGVNHVISRGPTTSGISNSSRKAYVREVLTVEAPPKKA